MSDVRLRPLRASDVDQLVRTRIEEAGTMGNPAPARPEDELRAAIEERVAHSGTHHRGELLLGIEVDGRLVGEIQARCPENGVPPGVYELGIGLFATVRSRTRDRSSCGGPHDQPASSERTARTASRPAPIWTTMRCEGCSNGSASAAKA